jgi:hypothetical protein
MAEAKLAPNLPQWMKDHTERYLSSGGTDGHIYTLDRAWRARDHRPVVAADHDRT